MNEEQEIQEVQKTPLVSAEVQEVQENYSEILLSMHDDFKIYAKMDLVLQGIVIGLLMCICLTRGFGTRGI